MCGTRCLHRKRLRGLRSPDSDFASAGLLVSRKADPHWQTLTSSRDLVFRSTKYWVFVTKSLIKTNVCGALFLFIRYSELRPYRAGARAACVRHVPVDSNPNSSRDVVPIKTGEGILYHRTRPKNGCPVTVCRQNAVSRDNMAFRRVRAARITMLAGSRCSAALISPLNTPSWSRPSRQILLLPAASKSALLEAQS